MNTAQIAAKRLPITTEQDRTGKKEHGADMNSESHDAVAIRRRCGWKRQMGRCCDTVLAERSMESGLAKPYTSAGPS